MDTTQIEALRHVTAITERLLREKFKHRKKLTQDETWDKATTIRDIQVLREFIVANKMTI